MSKTSKWDVRVIREETQSCGIGWLAVTGPWSDCKAMSYALGAKARQLGWKGARFTSGCVGLADDMHELRAAYAIGGAGASA